jgi:phosphoglycolate phosphatase
MSFKKFPLHVSAIVLDLDGTLLHTAPELAESANRMLKDMGRAPVSQDLLMSYIGNGISSRSTTLRCCSTASPSRAWWMGWRR